VCDILARAAKGRVTGGATNLAFGARVSLNHLISLVEQEIGHPVEVAEQPSRPGDVRHSQALNDRLRALFPEVQPVPIEVGLAETIAWMREELAQPAELAPHRNR
jgi:UDP-glucose 4-epimerase